MSNELLNVKIEEYKSNEIQNWISIGVQFSSTCPNKFLIFVTSELLGVKLKSLKPINSKSYMWGPVSQKVLLKLYELGLWPNPIMVK